MSENNTHHAKTEFAQFNLSVNSSQKKQTISAYYRQREVTKIIAEIRTDEEKKTREPQLNRML